MKPEQLSIKNKAENKEKESNLLDAEFDTLEAELSPEERMVMTRELFGEVFDRDDFQKHLLRINGEQIHKKEGTKIRHFFLPDIPGGKGVDIKSIREGYDGRSEYLKSKKRIFLKVGQGEMWIIPKSENPYFQTSMSECSTIVGTNDENFFVAHISNSAKNETEEVLNFMKNAGLHPEDIRVIASVGDFQKKRSDEDFTKRMIDKDSYLAMGIPKANISQFEFSVGEKKVTEPRFQKTQPK